MTVLKSLHRQTAELGLAIVDGALEEAMRTTQKALYSEMASEVQFDAISIGIIRREKRIPDLTRQAHDLFAKVEQEQ
eukprot:1839896-Karenia_brevis.AAC.1